MNPKLPSLNHLADYLIIEITSVVTNCHSLLKSKEYTNCHSLLRRGIACNPICTLCDQELESAAHISVACSYVKEVWASFEQVNAPMVRATSQASSVKKWWSKIHACVPKIQRIETVKLASYITWNIWKERGQRVFQGKEMNAVSLAQKIKDEMAMVTAVYLL
jgi:hypothetical protein